MLHIFLLCVGPGCCASAVFVHEYKGGAPLTAGRTQLGRVTLTAGGQNLSLLLLLTLLLCCVLLWRLQVLDEVHTLLQPNAFRVVAELDKLKHLRAWRLL